MLSSILYMSAAIKTSVEIMNVFGATRHYIGNNLLNQKYYNYMTIRHDSEIKLLQESFNKLEENKEINEIYFIIDKNKIYHSGSSVNHIGYRKSLINVLKDSKVKNALLNDIQKII